MSVLRIDLETYSSVDLKACGVHKYVESPDFEIMLMAYAFDDGHVHITDFTKGEHLPESVMRALFDPAIQKSAFNAAFEIACLSRHFDEPLDPAQWHCTSVHALYLGLPGNLADVGRVLGLDQDKAKMSVGWSLIRYFCIPCRPTQKNGGRTRNLSHHDSEKWELFRQYCIRDVEAEREIARRLSRVPVPEDEHRLWVLDQRMNTHGIRVDLELARAAIDCDERYRKRLLDEAVQLTGLDNFGSRNQLLAWLREAEQDDTIVDLTKKSVPKILEATDDAVVRRVLQLRQELAKTSVTKYAAMDRAACEDGRVRGLTQFYGANRTGRWAGRLVQVQNLPQNKLRDLDLARRMLKARDYESLELLFCGVTDVLSQLIRTAFIPTDGHRLLVVDFSAIEARVIAWMADCKWRLEVFATHGKIYEASAEQMFKLPAGSVTKKSPYRQRGKVAELALGYQGGVNALITMGALDMGLTEEELDPIKVAWREANPEIVKLWYAVERAAKEALARRTDVELPIGSGSAKLTFGYESGFLFLTLPSGRRLAYVKPRIETEDLYRDKADSRYVIASAGSITYEGQDQKTKQWTRLSTYGGKLVENITQAIARDCLREAMLALDALGYTQLMTIHDEIVIESPKGKGSLAEVEGVLGKSIAWAPGLLLRGDGFEAAYYQKEID